MGPPPEELYFVALKMLCFLALPRPEGFPELF
jgi:hypothetical protein